MSRAFGKFLVSIAEKKKIKIVFIHKIIFSSEGRHYLDQTREAKKKEFGIEVVTPEIPH